MSNHNRRRTDIEVHERLTKVETTMEHLREGQDDLHAFIKEHMESEEKSYAGFTEKLTSLDKRQNRQTNIVVGVMLAATLFNWAVDHGLVTITTATAGGS